MGRTACIGLILVGLGMMAWDIRTALVWGGAYWLPDVAELLLWPYALLSVVVGGLGLVLLDIAKTARH